MLGAIRLCYPAGRFWNNGPGDVFGHLIFPPWQFLLCLLLLDSQRRFAGVRIAAYSMLHSLVKLALLRPFPSKD